MAAWLLGTYICPTEQSLVGAPGHKPVLSVVIVPCMSTLHEHAAGACSHGGNSCVVDSCTYVDHKCVLFSCCCKVSVPVSLYTDGNVSCQSAIAFRRWLVLVGK